MIKAYYIKSVFARVFFAAHQLFRANQEAIAFGFLFARIRNWISLEPRLCDPLQIVPALVRNIRMDNRARLLAHLGQLSFFKFNHLLWT